MTSAPPITFDVRPSRVLIGVGLAAGAVAAVGCFFTGFSLPVRGLLAAVPLAWAALAMWRAARPGIVRVTCGSAGQWVVVDGQGRSHPAALAGVLPLGRWTVLRLRWAGRVAELPVGPDTADAETRRLLSIRLGQA
jgi:hypothetical protein